MLPLQRPRAEPKQMHIGKETTHSHHAKKSSSEQSKSRLFSDTNGQQPNPQGLGQTEVKEANTALCLGRRVGREIRLCTPYCTITEALLSALKTNISGQMFINFPLKPNTGCKFRLGEANVCPRQSQDRAAGQ